MSFHEHVLMMFPLAGAPDQVEIYAITIETDAGVVQLPNCMIFFQPEFEIVIRKEGTDLQLISRKRARKIWDMKMEAEKDGRERQQT